MSNTMNAVSKQVYYHREYTNDINNLPDPGIRECAADLDIEQSWLDQSKRVATTALPFLALYKPLSLPLSLTMGGLRTVGAAHQFVVALQTGTIKDISWALLETVISVIALVGTLLAHPLGMLITTGHDLVIEMTRVVENAKNGEFMKIAENFMSMANNALYLALMLDGSIGLSIASLASQMLVAIYHAQAEFKKENFIEGMGHLLMALVRGNQMMGQIAIAMRTPEPIKPQPKPILGKKLTDEELMQRAKATNNKALIEVLNKYHNNGRFGPALYNAVDKCDWNAMELLIKNNAQVNYPNISRFAQPELLHLALSKQTHAPSVRLRPTAHVIETLLKAGAPANVDYTSAAYKKWTNDNRPIAVYLIDHERNDLLEVMLKYGMNPNSPFTVGSDNRTLITHTIIETRTPSQKRFDAIKLLLKYKADPDLCAPFWILVGKYNSVKGYHAKDIALRKYYDDISQMIQIRSHELKMASSKPKS